MLCQRSAWSVLSFADSTPNCAAAKLIDHAVHNIVWLLCPEPSTQLRGISILLPLTCHKTTRARLAGNKAVYAPDTIQAPAAVRIWFESDLKGAKVDAVVVTNTGRVKMLDERRIAGRLIEVKLPQFSTAHDLSITIHKHLRKAAVPKSLEFGFLDFDAPCEP